MMTLRVSVLVLMWVSHSCWLAGYGLVRYVVLNRS